LFLARASSVKVGIEFGCGAGGGGVSDRNAADYRRGSDHSGGGKVT
jgi:hypothetical protein